MVSISSILSPHNLLERLWKIDNQPVSVWGGTGAELLPLTNPVERATLRNLLRGFSPDGQPALVMDAGSTQRQPGWEITFNAPKSVSVLWALKPMEHLHLIAATRKFAWRSGVELPSVKPSVNELKLVKPGKPELY